MNSTITKFAIAAVIVIAVILGLNNIGGTNKSGQVFASVIEQIRNARTATFTTEIQMGQQNFMRIEHARKEPGLSRATMPGGLILISDLTQQKSITIDSSIKQYTIMDLKLVPADQRQDFFESMRTLSDKAKEVLPEKEIDGRMVRGFRVIEHGIDATCWVDIHTGDLVRVEGQFPNAPSTHIIAKDFKFDIELNDAFFSLTPPPGYTSKEPVKTDNSDVNCQDLINLLRWWATNVQGGMFPSSLELAEYTKELREMKETGKVSEFGGTKDEKMQQMMKLSRGIQFVMMMKPENDWHYAGKGVEFGNADTAICWYRPQGSTTYRVIYGDLSFVNDVTPTDLPK